MTLQEDIRAKKLQILEQTKILNNLQNDLKNFLVDSQVANIDNPQASQIPQQR